MAETECYICPERPVVEVHMQRASAIWLVPLCRLHAGDGIAILQRMFPEDVEFESFCQVLRPGEFPVVDAGRG